MRKIKHLVDLREPIAGATDSNFRVYVKASKNEEHAELYVVDVVGDNVWGEGVTAGDVKRFLSDNRGRQVNIQINSPGGLAYDGLSIYNDLTQHDGRIEVTITGLAFSAASVIAMAGDVVRMHEASDFGIHRASMLAYGNKRTMEDSAVWLENLDQHLLDIYQARTGADREKIEQWLDGTEDGTLWKAKDAVEIGFADEVIPAKKRSKNAAEEQITNMKRRIMSQHRLRELRTRR